MQQKLLMPANNSTAINTTEILLNTFNDKNSDDALTLSQVDASSENFLPSIKIFSFAEANKIRTDLYKQLESNPKSIPINWALMRYYLTAPNLVGGSNYEALHYAGYIYSLDRYLGCIAYETVYNYMREWNKAEEWYRNSLNVSLPKTMFWQEITYSRKNVASLKVVGNFNNWKMQNMYEKTAGLYSRKVMVPICEGCQYKLVVNNSNIQEPTKTEITGNSWQK